MCQRLPPELETPACGDAKTGDVGRPRSYDLRRFTGKLNQPRRKWRSGWYVKLRGRYRNLRERSHCSGVGVTGKRGLDPALTLSPRGAIVPFNTTWGRTELNPFRTVKVGNNPPGF